MWVTRIANALFDPRFTDAVVENLDDYLRYGVNTVVVGIQGGNLQTGKNHLFPRVYHADGTLDLTSVVWPSLLRLLAETDRRGMVLMIQYWYCLRDEEVPDDASALACTRRVTEWLRNTGHHNFVLDVVNEFGHSAYEVPGQPGVKRPLFTTLDGALAMLHAVYGVMPDVVAGLSPVGGLAAPEGFHVTRFGLSWVESGIILGHNQVSDPLNPSSYRVGSKPRDPSSKPCVNNEFDSHLGSERYPQKDPVTGQLTYGHFTASAVDRYLADLRRLRQMGTYANVFSSRQQFIPPAGTIPNAFVGPEGTQPEASSGAGEGSVHWIFAEIAAQQKRGSLAHWHDFENGLASGIERHLGGAWAIAGGRLEQTEAHLGSGFARLVIDGGDMEVALDAAFLAEPGAAGRLAVQLGAPTPAGPAYRLRIGKSAVALDQLGGSLGPAPVVLAKNAADRYRLQIEGGRVQVFVNGSRVFDEPDPTPLAGRNLLLVTEQAAGAFDHVRSGPVRATTFDDGSPGPWIAGDPQAWQVRLRQGSGTDRIWEATVPANDARHAWLDLRFADFEFTHELDLSAGSRAAFRFRMADARQAWSDGYSLWVDGAGNVALDRVQAGTPPIQLACGQAAVTAAAIRVRTTVEGNRIVARVDGKKVIDTVDPGAPFEPGALALVALAGTTRFDNLRIEGGPSRIPAAAVLAPAGPAIPAGLAVEFTDPDGFLDLAHTKLLLDLGAGFFEITSLLAPGAGLFRFTPTADGKGARFTLVPAVPLGPTPLRLKAVATDAAGNTGEDVVGFNLP